MAGKPGRPRSLTLDQITQAALDDGLSEFSMPSVARRVGVAHSALYRYVTDRDDLLYHALEKAMAQVEWPDADQPWQDLLRAFGDAIWHLCETFPGYERAAVVNLKPSETFMTMGARYVASLQDQGFSVEDASILLDAASRITLFNAHEMSRQARLEDKHRDLPDELKAFSTPERTTGRGWYDRQLDMLMAGAASLRSG